MNTVYCRKDGTNIRFTSVSKKKKGESKNGKKTTRERQSFQIKKKREEDAIYIKHCKSFQLYKEQEMRVKTWENQQKNGNINKTEFDINHIQEATANQINNTENYQFQLIIDTAATGHYLIYIF